MTEAGPRPVSRSALAPACRDSRVSRRWWSPPWKSAAEGVSIYTSTIRPTKRTDPPDRKLEAVQETLAELPPADYTIYTDGSAAARVENGGAGPSSTEGRQS